MHFFYQVICILIMIFSIGLITLIHEIGHYIAAKITGVRVDRFAFGLPFCGPVIFKKKMFETEFIVHLLFFFGGYIVYPESNPSCELPMNSPRRFLNKTPLEKSFITLAGIFANILLSFFIIFFIGIVSKYTIINSYNAEFISFKNNANESVLNSGLKKNDVIYSINNKKIDDIIALQEYLRVYDKTTKKHRKGKNLANIRGENHLLIYVPDLYTNCGKTIIADVIRNNTKISLNPVSQNPDGSLGLNLNITENYAPSNTFINLIKNTFVSMEKQIHLIFFYLKELLTGQLNITDIRGIIAIIKTGSELMVYDNFMKGFWLISFLSLNMAIINLLPLPVLDGGRFLLILSGNLFMKRVRRSTMNKITAIIYLTLNIIFVFILFNDIFSIYSGII